jgi:hypothetical protein
MYILAQRVAWEARRDIAFGDIDVTYTPVGDPLINPVRMLKIVNDTDVAIDISDDGSTDKDIISAGSAFIYDFTSNTTPATGSILALNKGTQIYVKGNPTSGSLYIVVIYASTNGG